MTVFFIALYAIKIFRVIRIS